MGTANDSFEEEADRVADEVMRTPEPTVQRQPVAGTGEETVQMKAVEPSVRLSTAVRGELGLNGGHPLPDGARRFFEPRMGVDFGGVKVHTGAEAAAAARGLNAQAFTVGRDIGFARGHYNPASHGGRQLLAHELTHVVQQTAGAEARNRRPVLARKPVNQGRGSRGEQLYRYRVGRINELLSYGLFDWAITDQEALSALSLLEEMSSTERASALTEIDSKRLRENLPEAELPRLDTILRQTEGARANIEKINNLLSYGLFDWAITDEEAIGAFERLRGMPEAQRVHAVMSIERRRLYENLPEPQATEFALMVTEARVAWERSRQQGDPLAAGDRVHIYVYNRMGQSLEQSLTGEYSINSNERIRFPLLGEMDVKGLRPNHIAAKIQTLLAEDYIRAPHVKVEVTRREGEAFEPEKLEVSEGQPEGALESGDTFELKVIEQTTWTEETDFSRSYQIDRHGNVEMQHLGRIPVEGLNREEISGRIQAQLKDWYRTPPQVWVWVTSHDDKLYRAPEGVRPKALAKESTAESVRQIESESIPRRTPVDVYLDFFRSKQQALAESDVSERDRRVGQEALRRYLEWVSNNAGDPEVLDATSPWAVYGEIHTPLLIVDIERETRREVGEARRSREDTQRRAAVKEKLDEYWQWAMRRWREASVKFRSAGRAYLLTEHPYRKIGMNALTRAVMTWAYDNTDHPAFLERSPDEVAEFVQAKDPHLRTIVQIGRQAKPRLEYFPELDRTRYTMGDLATETIVGILPVAGEMADVSDAVTGVSITGHELSVGDRTLAAFGALIPFVPASALRSGKKLPRVVDDFAMATGRSADEIEAVFRVAGHLDAGDVRELDRIMDAVAEGKELSRADLDILDDIGRKLKDPLEDVASAVRRGESPKVGKLRVDPTTQKQLVPGTEAHRRQRWLEYQFRHPEKFDRITEAMDPKWRKAYETILANKKAGGVFERSVLDALGYSKNKAMMIAPEAEDFKGFIPDAVRGSPDELVWGQPYHFVEVKGWTDMSKTGNLKEMIKYVKKFEGHIEVVFRSAKHSDGETSLTGPLQRALESLVKKGKATVHRHP